MDERDAVGKLNVLRATLALFTSAQAFAREYVEQLERGSRITVLLMSLRAQGKRPHHSTPAGKRLSSDEARTVLLYGLRRTLRQALIAVALAVFASYLAGAAAPALPWHPGKVLQAVGTAFALWGTLFALSVPARSLGGTSSPELVHGFLFTTLLGIGGFLVLLGTLL